MELFFAAFITGLIGSLHCAGMCGPLAIAFNLRGNGNSVLHTLVYNCGRIAAYGLLGIVFGFIGFGFMIAGWQQLLTILTGAFILLLVIVKKYVFKTGSNFVFQKIGNWIRSGIQIQQKKHSFISSSALGFLNGFLPCGLVYLALAGAVATGSMLSGFFYMLLFGLGTYPMMFMFATAGKFMSIHQRLKLRRIIPVFSILIGCLLIIRGLNLGIPYLSPHFDYNNQAVECCTSE